MVALAGCAGPRFTLASIGTRMPVSELRSRDADLRAVVVEEITRNHDARAYFALDLLKTRPFAELQPGRRPLSRALHDLRPLFDPLLAEAAARRGVNTAQQATHTGRGMYIEQLAQALEASEAPSQVYWDHVALLERRIGALNRETPGIPYSYAARKVYGVSSVEETQQVLSPGEVLLSFVVHDERVFGFVLAADQLIVRRLPRDVRQIRELLAHLLGQVEQPPTWESRDAWKDDAIKLHDAILGPFARELGDPSLRTLFVSPDDFLASVPFALLLEAGTTGRQPLLARLRVSYMPSVSVYRQLLERPILNDSPRVLAIADAIYPAGMPALPFAAREAATVSELFPDSALLTGEAATEAQIVELAPRYNIVHVATHGLLLDRMVRGASSLLVTADAEHDGYLNEFEIASLDLSRTYVAVLSACQSAVAARDIANEPGSLTSAFLIAGVPSVIGSLWQVEDESTTLFMLEFYKRFLELGAAEALRKAMEQVQSNPRFAHPHYWAAFVLYGWDK
jgi:CHAT domain-containing protein